MIPTLKYLAENNAKVIVISHFGRPKGKVNPEMSTTFAKRISELLAGIKVNFASDCMGQAAEDEIAKADFGDVVLLENLRFYQQETENDEEFSQKLASCTNVNDAFSCSHRAHASIVGISKHPKSCAGFLLELSWTTYQNTLMQQKPILAIIGGAKVSTKYSLINNLVKVDIVIGGGMANSFLYAQGHDIGNSLCEKDLKDEILQIIAKAEQNNCKIIIPQDVVVTKKFENNAQAQIVKIDEVQQDDIIGDIGSDSLQIIGAAIKDHNTVLWNGPVGAFETKPFDNATFGLAKAIVFDKKWKNNIYCRWW